MTYKTTLLLFVLIGLAGSASAQTITAVSPNAAPQGTSGQTVTFTLSGMVPPADIPPDSVTIGTLTGTSVAHPSQYSVTAVFDFPFSVDPGTKDATVTFVDPFQNLELNLSMSDGFTVTAGADTAPTITEEPSSATVYLGFSANLSVSAYGSDPMTYQWQKDLIDVDAATGSSYSIAAAAELDAGNYRCIIVNDFGSVTSAVATLTINTNTYPTANGFAMIDTMQTNCYSDTAVITAPVPGEAFAGQDAQYTGTAASYTLGGDGLTVYDNHTGLTWTQSADTDRDGDTDTYDKLTYAELFDYADSLNAEAFGGFTDWRVPSIKETYSLMDFRGVDPSGYEEDDTSGLIPFIDDDTFDFAYGDTANDERIIDSQYGSTSLYVDGEQLLFGVNFADGRIKGYGLTLFGSDKTFSAMFCRGNEEFGINDFALVSSNIVVDHATGLMWQQADSVDGLNWKGALAYAEGLELDGYCDWRLPTAKELEGIVDYTRSPGTTDSAAIDPIFSCTAIINEAGQADYAQYWTGTTHDNWVNSTFAVYIAFGRAMGYDSTQGWTDVHGAGCQRSDPKSGEPGDYEYVDGGYYNTLAPQGDNIRIYNMVRCVRGGAAEPETDTDNDGLSDWYEYNYAAGRTAMDPGVDDDGDGILNGDEHAAGTSPSEAASCFRIFGINGSNTAESISWASELDRSYTLQSTTDLVSNVFTTVESGIATTAPTNTYLLGGVEEAVFYRVLVEE